MAAIHMPTTGLRGEHKSALHHTPLTSAAGAVRASRGARRAGRSVGHPRSAPRCRTPACRQRARTREQHEQYLQVSWGITALVAHNFAHSLARTTEDGGREMLSASCIAMITSESPADTMTTGMSCALHSSSISRQPSRRSDEPTAAALRARFSAATASITSSRRMAWRTAMRLKRIQNM
eukprot:5371644-Prymnesium_polylepis.1